MDSFVKSIKKLIKSYDCDYCIGECNAKHFQQNFKNWTSGDNDIDKFIQDTQLLAHGKFKNVLEWIPYNRFYDIKYIAKGRFGEMYYIAYWFDGFIDKWNNKNKDWNRNSRNMFVILKKYR